MNSAAVREDILPPRATVTLPSLGLAAARTGPPACSGLCKLAGSTCRAVRPVASPSNGYPRMRTVWPADD